ncbi:hypothetical protein E2C01_091772 [Portunus trituberculatus]|uniref:Uncharacterized protein n=1 Tax=Portunus trituberculatus TaxID=210409 RepID=A0A5B7JNV0_PORTR|nr:hypothetical protein [Portunus trituberculatus]
MNVPLTICLLQDLIISKTKGDLPAAGRTKLGNGRLEGLAGNPITLRRRAAQIESQATIKLTLSGKMSVAANPFPRLPSKPFSFDNQSLKAPLGHPGPSEFKRTFALCRRGKKRSTPRGHSTNLFGNAFWLLTL